MSETKAPEKKVKTMNAKAMLKGHGKKGTKIKYKARKKIKIIEDTKYLKKGDIKNPHVVMADQLIKDGIAEAV